jgi:hypothetical protein
VIPPAMSDPTTRRRAPRKARATTIDTHAEVVPPAVGLGLQNHESFTIRMRHTIHIAATTSHLAATTNHLAATENPYVTATNLPDTGSLQHRIALWHPPRIARRGSATIAAILGNHPAMNGGRHSEAEEGKHHHPTGSSSIKGVEGSPVPPILRDPETAR